MARITFEYDRNALDKLTHNNFEKALFKALKLAGSGAVKRLRAASKRGIRARKRIKAKYLADKSLPLTYPKITRGLGALEWRMDVSGKEVPLSEYPARQTKKGVRVEVNAGQAKTVLGAFIAIRKSGSRGVFKRPGKERFPMGHLLSSSVDQVFHDSGFVPKVQKEALDVLARDFNRIFKLEAGKLK